MHENNSLSGTIFTTGLAACGLLMLLFLEPIRLGFLETATRFDDEGVISRPDWLYRPLYTMAGMLLFHAGLRFVFERQAGQSLEKWVIAGAGRRRIRYPVLAATFIGLPALFLAFAYAVTHPPFWSAYYQEDRFFENATAVLLLAGGVLAIFGAAGLLRSSLPWSRAGALAVALLGSAFVFLGLEEMSYGQRLFGWSTPEAMQEDNLQGETNLHNYWTHEIQADVIWLAAVLMLTALSAAAVLRRLWRHPWGAFLPDQAFLPYGAALLLLASHPGFHEVLEQAAALFAVLYGFQLAAMASRPHPTVRESARGLP